MSQRRMSPTTKSVLVALCVMGAATLLCFGASLLVSGEPKSMFRMLAMITAMGSALLGLVFAFVAGKR
ncbi:hypothetical protein [Gulosibacter chungangensis]|uniref:Uncharacterized protein n=1 Tax=Gulosibacter chungangensis TaxID=979746 RepID=A0A7J5BAU1_9MICO|nr:hypothetical protein [Gulosibacter chungangensis]KAB1643155.1 hypothetical protein F8O05_07915 [Gulosibacter chungangensis]